MTIDKLPKKVYNFCEIYALSALLYIMFPTFPAPTQESVNHTLLDLRATMKKNYTILWLFLILILSILLLIGVYCLYPDALNDLLKEVFGHAALFMPFAR